MSGLGRQDWRGGGFAAPVVTAPWSPSEAREAARAALARYLRQPSPPAPVVAYLRALLEADVAFDERGTYAAACDDVVRLLRAEVAA